MAAPTWPWYLRYEEGALGFSVSFARVTDRINLKSVNLTLVFE